MKKFVIALLVLVSVILAVAGGGFAWGKSAAASRLATPYQVHSVDFPIPFPLTPSEMEALRAERAAAGKQDEPTAQELSELAKERAISRGKHLAEARYACVECHGANFGGGTMIDAPAMGVLKGKNLTSGKGGVVADYTAADWDRMVRHGVKRNGLPTAMPSEDYAKASDRELSDLISYIRSLPPVDNVVPEVILGPVGTMLMATGKIRLSAEHISHQSPHAAEAPAENTPEFGKHLVQVCTGCHNPQLTGGPVVGGDPAWPPALNLTPHADGLAGWSYDDFVRAMRAGKRKNGQDLRAPMSNMMSYAKNFTETEMKGMWGYLQSLPPLPSPAK